MAQDIVRVGIVGAGLMGREIAAALRRWPALIDHPVTPVLTAVCDINPAAMTWFEQIDTVTQFTTDYQELLANPDVDVVYIAVRHDLHEQLYVDAINAGKDVLAEKPYGMDAKAALAINAALAAHPDVFVRVSSEMPFFPGAQAAIAHIASGALGEILEVRSAFLHSSDLDTKKPINWKRQKSACGEAGVMNDLGMHAWHVPLRMGWIPTSLSAVLQSVVETRPDGHGGDAVCDTWDNATVYAMVDQVNGHAFPMIVETKRIAPGHKNTWLLEVIGMNGAVRFSTKQPKTLEVFGTETIPGVGREQVWKHVDVGSQSVWQSVTGGIFETGFSDAILQMWGAFLAERAGQLDGRFGCATPSEALTTHELYEAAIRSNADRVTVTYSS